MSASASYKYFPSISIAEALATFFKYKYRHKILFCLLILLCVAFFSQAQLNKPYDFKFKTYTFQDGLVHNFTKKCAEDSKGFLWIITQHGLSRFDGLNFKNFEHIDNDSTSLPENDLTDIAIDSKDRIWLCYNTGVCFFDQSKQIFYPIKQNSKSFQCYSLLYDSISKSIFCINCIGFMQVFCNDLSTKNYTYQHVLGTSFGVGNVLLDKDRKLWIPCYRRGYYCIDINKKEEFYYDYDIWPTGFYQDEKNLIWMTTWDEGLININTKENKYTQTVYSNASSGDSDNYAQIQFAITQNNIVCGDSLLLVANLTGGVMLFDENEKKFIYTINYDANSKNGIPTDFINYIYTDKKNITWVCTWHGIAKINRQEQQFKSKEVPFLKSNFYNRVAGIEDDPNNKNIVWLAADGSGILKVDKQSGQLINRYFAASGNVNKYEDDLNKDWRWAETMLKDHSGNIWVTTYGGLIKISNETPQKIPILFNGEMIYPTIGIEGSKNDLWFACEAGVLKYETKSGKYFLYNPGNDKNGQEEKYFRDIIKNNDNSLFVAVKGGLYSFDLQTGRFTKLNWNVKDFDSITQHNCYCICKINNYLYIGTEAGLIQYNLTNNKATAIGIKAGVSKILNYSLKADDNNNLWIYTSSGLYEYKTKENSFQKFTTADGLYDLSNDKIGFFRYDNLFYIGYRMAFTAFDPLKVNNNAATSNPVITDVLINKKPFNTNADSFSEKSLELSYKQHDISFNYTAPDFTNTDKVTFMYQLEGFDTNWIQTNTRVATFTNLAPGKYTFHVKACNSSGVWNNEPASFSFVIATPFWETWWFYLIMATVCALAIYQVYRFRLKRVLTLYKIRDDISKNLHDEIGATLSSINIYSEVAKNKLAGNDDIHTLLNRIHEGSAQVMESMSDIVWYVNPKNDSFKNVIIKMKEYAAPLLEAQETFLNFTVDAEIENIKLTMQQRQNVYLFFKEAINNISKYANAKSVSVNITGTDVGININIRDDGKGFEINNNKKGNGLYNMQQRAKFLHGKYILRTEPLKGTDILLSFPISL